MNSAKLDTLLSLMNEKDIQTPMSRDALTNYLSIIEFEDYSSKLVQDGYAEFVGTGSKSIALTRKGASFIRNGGYTLMAEKKLKTNTKRNILVAVSIFSLVLIVALLFVKVYFIFKTT